MPSGNLLLGFLSHLSGDEGRGHAVHGCIDFLSHLSGDEAYLTYSVYHSTFLSHLSGDEDVIKSVSLAL